MVRAYVMVKAHSGDAERLRDEILDVDGVEDAYIVAGDVDFIATVSVDETADVKAVSATHIQSLDGIEDTQTYVAMD
ncbi:Lrp/AsnC family transcriptional regulator [Halosimplex salinum]|uniref:Lrp/AsnC family transcriptional regulator n=1 Tax=Halosimplex salinum TaxID=1710538 RepID=UPI000F4A262E|nr:Lrp/AsnC ligand binding domain-containing protein [Halosimplex salinum]